MTNRFKCNGKMEPSEHGAYVLHSDYKALEKERDELKKQNEKYAEFIAQKAFDERSSLADD